MINKIQGFKEYFNELIIKQYNAFLAKLEEASTFYDVGKTIQGLLEKIEKGIGDLKVKPRYLYPEQLFFIGAHNLTFSEIEEDIRDNYLLCKEIYKMAKLTFSHSISEKTNITNSLKELYNVTMDFANYFNVLEENVLLFSDSFVNDTKIQRTTLDLNKNGYLTLGIQSFEDAIRNGTKIELQRLNDSGFPGNTKEVELKEEEKNPNEGFFSPVNMNTDAKPPEYTFVGERNPAVDITAIIDNNYDTWYEFEAVATNDILPSSIGFGPSFRRVNTNVINQTKGFNFSYVKKDGSEISWDSVPKDGELRVMLFIELPEVNRINSISILPFYNKKFPNYTFRVRKIFLSADNINYYEIGNLTVNSKQVLPNVEGLPNKREAMVYNFAPQDAKFIKIEILQDMYYPTLIGHIFYERHTQVFHHAKKRRLFRKSRHSVTVEIVKERIPGPAIEYENLEKLVAGVLTTKHEVAEFAPVQMDVGGGGRGGKIGVAGGITTLKYAKPLLKKGAKVLLKGVTKLKGMAVKALGAAGAAVLGVGLAILAFRAIRNFFRTKRWTTIGEVKIISGIEAFNGVRWAIAIRDIGIYGVTYFEEGEMESIPYTTDNDIFKVSLQVNEEIPSVLADMNKPFIFYSISIDNGNTWLDICPIGHGPMYNEEGKLIPETYVFSDTDINIPENAVLIKERTRSIQLKVKMKRPTNIENAENLTPILHDYILKVATYKELS